MRIDFDEFIFVKMSQRTNRLPESIREHLFKSLALLRAVELLKRQFCIVKSSKWQEAD